MIFCELFLHLALFAVFFVICHEKLLAVKLTPAKSVLMDYNQWQLLLFYSLL